MESSDRHEFASYDKRLISILEIISAHFVNIYYNHVHRSSALKATGSHTDEYVRQVQAFIVGVKTDEQSYHQVVQLLHEYFRQTTRYATLSFGDFVEQITQQFIPKEFFDALKMPEKDETLNSIIADLVSSLGAEVTKPESLQRIIDEHNDRPHVTIRMLQDKGVTILLAKRGEIHNMFLRRIGQAKDTVSMDIVEDLKAAIRKLVKQKASVLSSLGEAEERVMELEDEVAAFKAREAKFKKLIKMLQDERSKGKTEVALGSAVPPRSVIAEVEDPLDFVDRQPVDLEASRIAEKDNPHSAPKGAGFFASADLPLRDNPSPRDNPPSRSNSSPRNNSSQPAAFSIAPPEAYGGLAPDLRSAEKPVSRRRATGLSALMEQVDESDATDETDESDESGESDAEDSSE